MIKIKDYRRRSPKQVTIFVLMKEEIVFGQKYYFFGIWIGSPGMRRFRLIPISAKSGPNRFPAEYSALPNY